MTAPPLRKGSVYRIEGIEYPSVTSILRVIAKPALTAWLQKQAAKKALEDPKAFDTPEKVLAALNADKDAAGWRGSNVHAIAHEYTRFLRGEISADELRKYETDPYYPGIVSFFETMKPDIIASELTVFNREHVYAGTLDLLATMQDGKRYVLDWKRLALDTLLPTPTGWTTMGEVSVGDTLYDRNGSPCRVTNVSEIRYDEDCYKITLHDGITIVAGASHPWVVGGVGGSEGKERVMSTLEIEGRVRRRRATGYQRAYWIPVSNPISGSKKDLPIDPYVLGVWLGDGSAADGRITAHKDDIGHILTQFRRAGYFSTEPRADTNANGILRSNCVTAYFPELRRRLRECGILGNKHVPDIYLRASIEQRLSLLQGLMDTDGSISVPQRRFRANFTQTNPKIYTAFTDLVRGLGLRINDGHLVKDKNGNRLFEFTPIAPVFTLPRKAKKINVSPTQRTIASRRMIMDTERAPTVPTRCIEVDSPSHTYLCTSHYIPTHNTAKAVWPEYSLQIEAYRQADGAAVPGDPPTVEKWDGPIADAGAVVLLKPNGTFQFVKTSVDFRVFLSALEIYRWQVQG